MWWVSSCSESFRLLGWQAENTASGDRDRLGNDPQWVPGFLSRCSWIIPEQLRKRPHLRDQMKFIKFRQSTQNAWLRPAEFFRKFFGDSETWEMYSWAIPGSNVFRDWLFLVISGVSLETAANFLLFLNFSMILREKLCQLWRLNWFFIFITEVLISSYYEGKGQTVNVFWQRIQNQRLKIYRIILVFSSFLFIPFPWRETLFSIGQLKVQMGKSTWIILSLKEKCRLWRVIDTSPSISSFIDSVYFIFRQKKVQV